MTIERKYGIATTFKFPLIDRDAVDFENTPVTFQNSDSRIAKDGTGFTNTGASPAHFGEGIYIQSLSATEMQAAQIMVKYIDITATKLWEDQAVDIETYGNSAAMHQFDRNLPNPGVVGVAEAGTLTQTEMTTDLGEATDEHFKGRSVNWTTGPLAGQSSNITAYTATGGKLTYTEVTDNPVAGNAFIIL